MISSFVLKEKIGFCDLRSNHLRFLSSAVVMILLSTFNSTDLMVSLCVSGESSCPWMLLSALPPPVMFGKVGEELVLPCVRSKIRNFFSRPPVATQPGVNWRGKATDRTMWLCARVWRHSPVCGSQILLKLLSASMRPGWGQSYAEKSADPVAASVASDESSADQQAPLWPMKVPILELSEF